MTTTPNIEAGSRVLWLAKRQDCDLVAMADVAYFWDDEGLPLYHLAWSEGEHAYGDQIPPDRVLAFLDLKKGRWTRFAGFKGYWHVTEAGQEWLNRSHGSSAASGLA